MKRKIILIAALLTFTTALSACGSYKSSSPAKAKEPVTTESKSATETTTTEASDVTKESATETSSNSTEATTAAQNTSDCSLPVDSSSIVELAHALAVCYTDNNITYDRSDSGSFWNSTAYAVEHLAILSPSANIDEAGNVNIDSSSVKEFAAAVFSSFNGNTESLPQLDSNSGNVSYNNANDIYTFPKGDFDSTIIETTSCSTDGSGNYTIGFTIKLNDGSNTELGTWTMNICPTTYTGSGHPLFSYSISSFTKA